MHTCPAKVAATSFMSFRLAGVTSTASGMPCPSLSRLRLTPSLPRPVGLIFIPAQRGFGHRSIQRKPVPINALQCILFQQAQRPEIGKHPRIAPFPEAPIGGRLLPRACPLVGHNGSPHAHKASFNPPPQSHLTSSMIANSQHCHMRRGRSMACYDSPNEIGNKCFHSAAGLAQVLSFLAYQPPHHLVCFWVNFLYYHIIPGAT